MANKFTRFLSDFATGLTQPKGIMGNYTHATRLFIDNTMRLAPKTKFNYYVRFEMDPIAVKAAHFKSKHAEETGLLVKGVDLPKFTFQMDTLNQYNKKHNVYKRIQYDPVQFTMHDDNQGVISAMWALYYGYYIADRSNPTAAFDRDQYRNKESGNYAFGFDNGSTADFFKSVTIFTMGRRRFVGYTLVNPKIQQWTAGGMEMAAGSETAESTMSLQYEAVQYTAGTVSQGSPKGFANLHYDTVSSPLGIAGGGTGLLLGEGGVLDGLEAVFGAVGNGSAFDSPKSFLGTAIAAVNTYKNIRGLSKESILNEGVNILTSPGGIQQISNTISGAAGIFFPKNDAANGTTAAKKKVTKGGTGVGRQDIGT